MNKVSGYTGIVKILLIGAFVISACMPVATATPPPVMLPKLSPPTTVPATAIPATAVPMTLPTLTATNATGIWGNPEIPVEIFKSISDKYNLKPATEKETSNCIVEAGDKNRLGIWSYVLVAPFNTVTDNVDQNNFLDKWKNHSANFPASNILLTQEDLDFISSILGTPDLETIRIVSK
jgi:hypothetical protein